MCREERETKDRLHISEVGYQFMKEQIEDIMKGIGL